jgi:hypothetical protein
MTIYAVVDGSGSIINRVVLDDLTAWPVPDGCSLQGEIDTIYSVGGTLIDGVYTPPPAPPLTLPAQPQTILSQDLMAQFTTDDAIKIQAAVNGNIQFWLLWSAMQAQSDPMVVTNARFLQGWSALKQVLGDGRMAAIAKALSVTI